VEEPWITYWTLGRSMLLRQAPRGIRADEAEDLVQDVALAALLNPPRRRTRNGFLAFAKRVFKNRSVDAHRSRSRLREDASDPAALDSRLTLASESPHCGQARQLRKLLGHNCLSRREQEVVTLWLGGVTEIKAIARELGIRPSTVRQYWKSAIKKLRKALEHGEEYSPLTT
jgi:RNA polymerase sigma factor (sigma-70 family)